MRTSYNSDSVSRQSYLSADGDLVTPDHINKYLLSVFIPERYGGVPIPDGNPTPTMMKTFMTEFVASWVSSDATVMSVWTPGSPTALLKFFVQINPGAPWAYLGELPLSQPLYENYQKARLVSAGFLVRSASQAAGVFTLAGESTSVYVNTLPPFNQLNYNSLLSWIPNGGSAVKGVPVQYGNYALYSPNGFTEFWNPEASWSYQFKELWDYTFSGLNQGWTITGPLAPTVLPAASTTVVFDSRNGSGSGFPFGNLPSPFYGNYMMALKFMGTITNPLTAVIKIHYYDADPLTWNPLLVEPVIQTLSMFNTAGADYWYIETPILTSAANIEWITVELISTVATTITLNEPSRLSVVSYDYYRPNVMSPAVITMTTRVNKDQPVSLSGTYNYELVPNPNLARNVTVVTHRDDDICGEAALAVLGKVGKGVQMIWNRRDYDMAVAEEMFHRLSSGKAAYEAAGPGLKSRLMQLWKAANPYLSEMAVTAGKSALGAGLGLLTANYPVLAPATGFISSQYLSADKRQNYLACDSKEQGKMEDEGEAEYLCADVEKSIEATARKPRALSDFVNIVNAKSVPFETPRVSYFPVVPAADNYNGVAQAVRLVISTTSLAGRNYPRQIHEANSEITIHYNDFFHNEAKIQFMYALVHYAYRCGILDRGSDVYFCVDSPIKTKGSSWQLSAMVAMLGIGGDALYSGGISFENPWFPTVTMVGQVANKAKLAKEIGVALITAADIEAADVQEILKVSEIVYPGFLCSGKPLPSKPVVFAIVSPMDVVLFNMRQMKHRVNMSVEEQALSGKLQVKSKTPKAPEAGLEEAKRGALQTIEKIALDLIGQVDGYGLSGTELHRSLKGRVENWNKAILGCGTVSSVHQQTENIITASRKIEESMVRAQKAGLGTVGKKGRKSKEVSERRKGMINQFEYEDYPESSWDQGESESSGSASTQKAQQMMKKLFD